jgi:hypothetical protein
MRNVSFIIDGIGILPGKTKGRHVRQLNHRSAAPGGGIKGSAYLRWRAPMAVLGQSQTVVLETISLLMVRPATLPP